MAQDHFKTPPDPKRGYKRPKNPEKCLKVRAKPAKELATKQKSLQKQPLDIANDSTCFPTIGKGG